MLGQVGVAADKGSISRSMRVRLENILRADTSPEDALLGRVGDDGDPTICGWECAPSPRLCRRRHWEHPPPAANGHQCPRRTVIR